MIVWLIIDGVDVGLHRLVVSTGAGGPDQFLIGEVDRADPNVLGLADLVIEPVHRASLASLASIVAVFGFPGPPNRRSASP